MLKLKRLHYVEIRTSMEGGLLARSLRDHLTFSEKLENFYKVYVVESQFMYSQWKYTLTDQVLTVYSFPKYFYPVFCVKT
jgi:hypothetical protein